MSIFSRRGLLIVIEGGDATGKHTQTDRLRLRLEGQDDTRARSISFPRYETSVGQAITKILRGEAPHDPLVLQALMTVDRYDAAAKIAAWREAGVHVVLDRYFPSGLVYGLADGLPLSWLESIHQLMAPADLYFLLDLDHEVAVSRRPEPRDKYESNQFFRARIRKLYCDLWRDKAKAEPGRWFIEDAQKSVEAVSNVIWATVKSRL